MRKIQKRNFSFIGLLNKELNPAETAYVAMLGEDEKGVVRDFHTINHGFFRKPKHGGCQYFPTINSEVLSKAIVSLVKKGLKPCGLLMSSPHYRYSGPAYNSEIGGGHTFYFLNDKFKCFSVSDVLYIQNISRKSPSLKSFNWVTVE